MIVCPSCQKANVGNPARCEFCAMSFIRLTEEAKAATVKNVRKNTRMTKSGLIGVGIFAVAAAVCNLPSTTPMIIGCLIFSVIFGFPTGYSLSVIKGDAKMGAILGAVFGVLFGLAMSMAAGASPLGYLMLRGIFSGALGGLVTAMITQRKNP